MAIALFDECLALTVQGIKNLKLMAKLSNGSSISYPIDAVLKSGDESTIVGTIDEDNKTVTIGEQTMEYVEPYIEVSSFLEEAIKDRRGEYYNITIDFSFPKVSLYTNNQLKDFLFTSDGELAIANSTAIIVDNNDIQWICGYDLPLVVQTLEDTTGGGDNLYKMVLLAKTYNRSRLFEEQN